ncbi:hypothetical protein ACPUD8_16560 [Brevibacterium sp. FAM 25378]|uniref:hypothetical protein n=1 Tax=unclassified Brevibacterium TaxID=2614124 RepID=UPI001092CEA9|nr:hypothetical protein [Brevibacterium sp. S22]TGD29166.1 hypothetical protein EB835_16675 [Brevibacterium sp. S22]
MLINAVKDAYRGLLLWDRRRIGAASAAAAGSAVVIGLATVLIPNSLFARDVPPVWWDYPVWILTAVLLGVLIASYVRSPGSASEVGAGGQDSASQERSSSPDVASERRSGVLGGVGGVLGWFAVGCPVCNKIALLALGYTGALTYFAPLQPILAAASVALLLAAVIIRLKGQYSCPIPSPERSVRS